MKSKGLDFKHKEVVNIKDGKRLGFVQDVTANLEDRNDYLYNSSWQYKILRNVFRE